MHLNSLRVLVAVHDYGSFQKAADAHGVTQSAVTKTIRKLEAHYGVLLIERGSKATLTSAGRALYDGAAHLLNIAATIENDILAEKTAVSGTVRVGSVYPLLQPIVLPVVATILQTHPASRLHLNTKLTSELLSQVADGRLDLAVAFDVKIVPVDVVTMVLGAQRYRLVTRSGGPFAGRHVTVEELARCQWLLPSKDIALRRALEQPFAEAGYGPLDVRVETDAGTFLMSSLIRETNLIAIMAEQSYRQSSHAGITAVQTTLPVPSSQVVLYQRRRTPSTGLFAEMKDALITAATAYLSSATT